jgi:hypothetical protein
MAEYVRIKSFYSPVFWGLSHIDIDTSLHSTFLSGKSSRRLIFPVLAVSNTYVLIRKPEPTVYAPCRGWG